MKLGIVGVEAAKLTPETEAKAIKAIEELIESHGATCVVSGECHLGGIDIIARDTARRLGLDYHGWPPKSQDWLNGYKPRNVGIAEDSEAVVCITVKTLPKAYTGTRFGLCYHCKSYDHVKSGGCWTTKYARSLGKPGWTIVIP